MTVQNIDSSKCSGCAYCADICPKSVITMNSRNDGNLFPYIGDGCIDCGLCIRGCAFSTAHDLRTPIETYVGCRSDKEQLVNSSSGGIFAALAEKLHQDDNWCICGCILDEEIKAVHTLTSDMDLIKKMYGSKYVQSNTMGVYKEVLKALRNGKKVLFSGTPCQVDAVKKYTKDHSNLFTVEIICHGVTSPEMFESYLQMLGKKGIARFVFRDKKQGWSYNNEVILISGKHRNINHRLSSYMTYYLNGETYREACYDCPFATDKRGADITIGDYWGVVREKQDKWSGIDAEKGVSCILVNTEKGREILETAPVLKYSVPYESIRKGNEPLNHPSVFSARRNDILREWNKNHSWKDVDIFFRKNDYSFVYKMWSMVPLRLQHRIRIILGKR